MKGIKLVPNKPLTELQKLKIDNPMLRQEVASLQKQLKLYGVGSSTYKIAISDRFCTYDFEMELPKTTCIRDIARRLYASFGLKEDNGRLRE